MQAAPGLSALKMGQASYLYSNSFKSSLAQKQAPKTTLPLLTTPKIAHC